MAAFTLCLLFNQPLSSVLAFRLIPKFCHCKQRGNDCLIHMYFALLEEYLYSFSLSMCHSLNHLYLSRIHTFSVKAVIRFWTWHRLLLVGPQNNNHLTWMHFFFFLLQGTAIGCSTCSKCIQSAKFSPGWVAQLVGAISHALKGGGFNSQLGHILRVWFGPHSGCVQEASNVSLSHRWFSL